MSISISVTPSAGDDLRKIFSTEMLELARRTGVRVELRGNDHVFWVEPSDTAEALVNAYDRLYATPNNSTKCVATWIAERK